MHFNFYTLHVFFVGGDFFTSRGWGGGKGGSCGRKQIFVGADDTRVTIYGGGVQNLLLYIVGILIQIERHSSEYLFDI